MEIKRIAERDILLTFQEAAELLRVSRATMYRLLASGQLVGHKVGRGWRFYKTDVHEFVASQTGSPRHAEAVTVESRRSEAA
jgi:excisionase family DNA binding protein